MDERAERTLAKVAVSNRRLAQLPVTAEGEIGRAVLSILASQDSIAVDDPVRFFRERIANSRSARGKTEGTFDFDRLLAEGAIKRLAPLLDD